MSSKPVARLVVEGEKPLEYVVGEEARLGRDPSCHLIFSEDDQISRNHARVFRDGQGYTIEDLKSRNGVFVNGVQVKSSPLKDGDSVTVGQTSLRFHFSAGTSVLPMDAESTIIAEVGENEELFSVSAVQGVDFTALKKAHANLKTVYSVSETLAGNFDIERVLNDVLVKIFDVVTADRGVVMLAGEDGSLRKAAQKVRGAETPQDITVSQTILRYVLEHRAAVLTTDATKDKRFTSGQSILLQHIQSVACVPMAVRKKILGVLQVETTETGRAFTREDLELLKGIGGQAAIAIENAQLLKKVEEEAEIRTNLQRYLAPQIAEQVIQKKVNLELGGEVQKITVLFSDVRGFTRMTEELGAREIVATLNSYFSRMVSIIFANGGTLDKFVGDAIMALWGVPIETSDNSVCAVRAAVGMQRELFLFNLVRRFSQQNPLYMGIGLNTGEAVVGNMGSPNTMQFTAMGGTVNQASRIEGKTIPGQVLISENTEAEIRGHFRVHELAPVELKGIEGKVRVFTVTGSSSDIVPEGLESLGEPNTVVVYLSCWNHRTGKTLTGRAFDVVGGECGMTIASEQADDLTEGDVLMIPVPPAADSVSPETTRQPKPAASDGAEPLTFRIASLRPASSDLRPAHTILTFRPF